MTVGVIKINGKDILVIGVGPAHMHTSHVREIHDAIKENLKISDVDCPVLLFSGDQLQIGPTQFFSENSLIGKLFRLGFWLGKRFG